MIKHLLKLTWNRKKSNALLMLTFFVTFLALFIIMIFIYKAVGHTFKPLGFSYDKVMHLQLNGENISEKDALATISHVKERMEALPVVAKVSLVQHAVPYRKDHILGKDITYKDQKTRVLSWTVDDDFMDVLKVKLTAGRWFNEQDNAATIKPIIINSYLQEELFEDENPVGKMIQVEKENMKIIGVAKDFRMGFRTGTLSGFFERNTLHTPGFKTTTDFLIRFKSPVNVASYEALYKITQFRMANPVEENPKVGKNRISTIEFYRDMDFGEQFIPIVLMAIICGFLVINVILGLFSILWQNINRRKPEIGLRRTMGAYAGQIYFQIVTEVLLMVSFGLLPGFAIALQLAVFKTFNALPQQYVIAAFTAASLIYMLVIICALYPSKLAASIHPAEALHEEG